MELGIRVSDPMGKKYSESSDSIEQEDTYENYFHWRGKYRVCP